MVKAPGMIRKNSEPLPVGEDTSPRIVRKDLPGELVARLQKDIVSGIYEPGERLTEQSLAARFGVSRTPLRVALQLVAAEGLLVLQPNRGAVIPRVTAEDVRNKLMVEGALIELAVQTVCDLVTEEDLAELERLKMQVVRAYKQKNTDAYFELVDRFSYTIGMFSRNQLLVDLYETSHRQVLYARSLGAFRRQMLPPTEAHFIQIIDALRRQNKRGARAAYARYMRTIIESVK